MAAESWWCSPLPGWLGSGTACFLFFNAILGAVVVLSWGRGGDATDLSTRRKRLTRSASSMVMERLRSMSTMFSVQYPAADDYDGIAPPASQLHHVQAYDYTYQEERDTREVVSEVEPEPAAMLLEESAAATTMAPRTPRAPIKGAVASTSGKGEREEAETPEEMSTSGAATLERPRKWKVAGMVERRAYAEMEEKAEVNARSERFIRQFWEDLKLERLNSILSCGRLAPARYCFSGASSTRQDCLVGVSC